MPICTSCANELPYLYTVYDTAYNLRLELCPTCKRFGDPYVEHDFLSLLLDLILLKREVYRHLVYNRGAQPRYVTSGGSKPPRLSVEEDRVQMTKERWKTCLRIGTLIVLADTFIRWTHTRDGLNTYSDREDALWAFSSIFLCCLVEHTFFHVGVNVASGLILRKFKSSQPLVGIDASHISLSLIYSSIAKNLLLFILAVWGIKDSMPTSSTDPDLTRFSNPSRFVEWLDPQRLPRQWIISSGLGGMTAGFGLRVILDWHPLLMTLIIFTGWATKAFIAATMSSFLWRSKAAFLRTYYLP